MATVSFPGLLSRASPDPGEALDLGEALNEHRVVLAGFVAEAVKALAIA